MTISRRRSSTSAYRATLDWLGSALAGALEPPARIAQRVADGARGVDRRDRVRRRPAIRRPPPRPRQRRRVAHPRARRRPQGLDAPCGRAGHPRRARRRRARARDRPGIPAGRRARIRRGAAHRRGGESESLSLLASDRHRRDVRRRGGGRLAPRASTPRKCSTRSAPPARRRPGSGSSTPTAR